MRAAILATLVLLAAGCSDSPTSSGPAQFEGTFALNRASLIDYARDRQTPIGNGGGHLTASGDTYSYMVVAVHPVNGDIVLQQSGTFYQTSLGQPRLVESGGVERIVLGWPDSPHIVVDSLQFDFSAQ